MSEQEHTHLKETRYGKKVCYYPVVHTSTPGQPYNSFIDIPVEGSILKYKGREYLLPEIVHVLNSRVVTGEFRFQVFYHSKGLEYQKLLNAFGPPEVFPENAGFYSFRFKKDMSVHNEQSRHVLHFSDNMFFLVYRRGE